MFCFYNIFSNEKREKKKKKKKKKRVKTDSILVDKDKLGAAD